VVLLTAWASVELAVAGMKRGAADFVTKPWNNERLLQTIATALALERARPHEAAVVDRADLDQRLDLGGLVGSDPALLRALDLVARVAPTDASVLVVGESGTGKELIAEALHRNSPRCGGPFVKVNLGGISSTLFESEMFGHVRGAFTDAKADRRGRFELAHGGTIFLDEIGEVEPPTQVKLLRVLQDRTFEVLGSSRPRQVDLRVVAATNADLPARVAAGSFRQDLLYRIGLITIRLPPLRERRSDIGPLARHFLEQAAQSWQLEAPHVEPDALAWLHAQAWPGNLRQLRQTMERAVLVGGGRIDAAGLAQLERLGADSPGVQPSPALPQPGSMTLDEIEARMIRNSLAHFDGNLTRVAEALGLSRQALYRRLSRHGIDAGSNAEQ
jgi:DNA-binding NtrC family response regulator